VTYNTHQYSILIPIFIICTSCGVLPSSSKMVASLNWEYTDLRAIDPIDTQQPHQDIIAAYIRERSGIHLKMPISLTPPRQIDIRLDFLDLDFIPNQDIYLAIDHLPGGAQWLPNGAQVDLDWDTLLILPANGDIQAIDSKQKPRQNLAVRIMRDPSLDTIVISVQFDQARIPPSSFLVQAYVSQRGGRILTDKTAPFALKQSPPPPAEVIFIYWNVFPAYTPAQALRRWDGAHTGPLGSRHGLYNLLRAARNLDIPLVLLDLKSPARLSAIEFARSLSLIQELSIRGLISLPDVVSFTYPAGRDPLPPVPDEFVRFAAADSRYAAELLGLPASQMIFAPTIPLDFNGYTNIFKLYATDRPLAQFTHNAQLRWTMVPFSPQLTGEIQQASRKGPTLPTRQQLVSQALENSHDEKGTSALVLGGDLVATTWGDPQSARETMRYFSAHPWIKPLTASDINTHPTVSRTSTNESAITNDIPIFDSVNTILLSELPNAVNDPMVGEAWHSYTDMLSPVYPLADELMTLRANYAGQALLLLAASRWNADPTPISNCQEDLDLDGELECVLANEYMLGFFDLDDGTLTHLFSRSESGMVHQWIAPSAQFTTATSDPSLWQVDAGSHADPDVIPGAFAETGGSYAANITADTIAFERPGASKIYRITGQSLVLQYNNEHKTVLHIPVAVDPWLRFMPGWVEKVQTNRSDQQITWSIPGSSQMSIKTEVPFTLDTYRDTWDLMGAPENPNYDYPSGHYLPFPVSLLTLLFSGNASLTLEVVD
jgi:hypothetical protein